jgi:GNAT superfamily N-acetyltransferase
MTNTIAIVDSSPHAAAALPMLAALSARLAAITGDDGARHFHVDAIDARACFLLAMEGEQAVGCGALRPLESAGLNDVGEIKRMYAHLAGRGVGSALLGALEERACAFGYLSLRLETRTVNRVAVAFYLRHGYVVCDNYGPYVGRTDAVCFDKRLACKAPLPSGLAAGAADRGTPAFCSP